MSTAAVEFDFEDVVSTVQRCDTRATRDGAEDAVQHAVMKMLEKGEPLRADYVVRRARSYQRHAFDRREAGNSSLDAARESDEDRAPREFAVDEVDFDAHARLREATENPVLRLRLDGVQAGSGASLQPRGTAAGMARYPDETVAEARRLRSEEGLTYDKIAKRLGVRSEQSIIYWCTGQARQLPTRPGWTRDLIVAALRSYAREVGRTPRSTDLVGDRRLPATKTFYAHFRSWADGLAAAGLDG